MLRFNYQTVNSHLSLPIIDCLSEVGMKTQLEHGVHAEEHIACPICDLYLREEYVRHVNEGECPRCGYSIYKKKKNSVTRVFIYSFTGLLLYYPAITMPLLTLESSGFKQSASLYDSVVLLYDEGFLFLSICVFLFCLCSPLLKLYFSFVVSSSIKFNAVTKKTHTFFKQYLFFTHWEMLEIFFLGMLISITKLVDLANVDFEFGFFVFSYFLFVVYTIPIFLDKDLFWREIEEGKTLAKC